VIAVAPAGSRGRSSGGRPVQEQEELWRRWRQGQSLRLIARQIRTASGPQSRPPCAISRSGCSAWPVTPRSPPHCAGSTGIPARALVFLGLP
jgi:hypothetical protein